jgi:hypothetical protein
MGGVWNTVKGGLTVPLLFEVFAGRTELTSTSMVVQPLTVTPTACDNGPQDAIELPILGGTALRYELGLFIYTWKTPKTRGCYVVTVATTDGSSISARFRIR